MTLDSAVRGRAVADAGAGVRAGRLHGDGRRARHQEGALELRGLRADLSGTRAPRDPHRFTAITLHFTVTGDVPDEKIERAIDSRERKYCSVWHSMRQDIELSVTYTRDARASEPRRPMTRDTPAARVSGLDARPGRAGHDRGARHRQLDARSDARHSWQFMWAMILGGFGAPLFLFLAGVSVALSAGSKARRTRRCRSRSACA